MKIKQKTHEVPPHPKKVAVFAGSVPRTLDVDLYILSSLFPPSALFMPLITLVS